MPRGEGGCFRMSPRTPGYEPSSVHPLCPHGFPRQPLHEAWLRMTTW